MAKPPRVLLVYAPYYTHITQMLIDGATAALKEAGATVDQVEVPGAFELPAVIKHALNEYHGFVALGCVIRGETSHYDYVCGECARGIQELALNHSAAIGFGVLTCENEEQALVRADPAKKNKGREAALACLRMIELRRRFSGL